MKEFVPGRGCSREAWDAVDSPEITDEPATMAGCSRRSFPV